MWLFINQWEKMDFLIHWVQFVSSIDLEDEETKSIGRWRDKFILWFNKTRILGEFRHTFVNERVLRSWREEEGKILQQGGLVIYKE